MLNLESRWNRFLITYIHSFLDRSDAATFRESTEATYASVNWIAVIFWVKICLQAHSLSRVVGLMVVCAANRKIYYILLYCSRLWFNRHLIAPPEASLVGYGNWHCLTLLSRLGSVLETVMIINNAKQWTPLGENVSGILELKVANVCNTWSIFSGVFCSLMGDDSAAAALWELIWSLHCHSNTEKLFCTTKWQSPENCKDVTRPDIRTSQPPRIHHGYVQQRIFLTIVFS